MIAVLLVEPLRCYPFYKIFESGTQGLVFEASGCWRFLMLIISAYIPFTKNAGMKLLSLTFLHLGLYYRFGLSSIFWLSVAALFFSGVLMVFGVDTPNHFAIEDSDHMRAELQP
jgi:hypothetical protein